MEAFSAAASLLLALLSCLFLLQLQEVTADSSSSSSSSSAEDVEDILEAAVQACVRKHEPPMIGGGDYAELAKLTSCVSDGMEALASPAAAAAVAKQIEDCVNGKPFPDPLKPTVASFLSCVRAAL